MKLKGIEVKSSKILDMLELQNKMNLLIADCWWEKDWDFMRAAAIETSEAIEHHGWKWWKAQKLDSNQLEMEIIDIWHFILSRFLQLSSGNTVESGRAVSVALDNLQDEVIFDNNIYKLSKLNLLDKLDLLGGLFGAKKISLSVFLSICEDLSLDMDKLYYKYVLKNILNIFRQENGYKSGTYVKIWDGKEDNEALIEIADTCDPKSENFCKILKQKLLEKYKLIKK